MKFLTDTLKNVYCSSQLVESDGFSYDYNEKNFSDTYRSNVFGYKHFICWFDGATKCKSWWMYDTVTERFQQKPTKYCYIFL